MKLLFDSDALIRSLNRTSTPHAQKLLDEEEHDGAISIINRIEVLTGAISSLEARTRAYLTTFTEVEITPEIAARTVRVRQGTRLKLPDAIIYASAIQTGRMLVTYNTRDFRPAMPNVLIPE